MKKDPIFWLLAQGNVLDLPRVWMLPLYLAQEAVIRRIKEQ